MSKIVLLKAKTHHTDKQALAFAKKLIKNNERECNLYFYGHPHRRKRNRWGGYRRETRRVPGILSQGPKPFVKIEFIHIEE